MAAPAAPSEFRTPALGDVRVVRFNKLALAGLAAFAVVGGLVMLLTLQGHDAEALAPGKVTEFKPPAAGAAPPRVFDSSALPRIRLREEPVVLPAEVEAEVAERPTLRPGGGGSILATPAVVSAEDVDLLARRRAALDKAVKSVPDLGRGAAAAASEESGAGTPGRSLEQRYLELAKRTLPGGDPGAAPFPPRAFPLGGGLEDPDPNKQEAKADFLQGEGTFGGDRVLAKRLEPPPAPFTLTEGTVVPCVLESGINSDLPGVLRARVSRTVYDSATGKVVLIPQGTLLSGEYQSVVAFGQSRLLVKGERLVFPDASSFSLESMPLADEEGYAGFDGDVNNHYLRTFGSAFLLGAISAGVQLGQGSFDDDSSVSDGETPREILAAAVSQQIGQVGAEVTRRNLDVQPTITVAPGKRFNIVVNKDMVFPGAYVEYGAAVESEEGN